MDGELFFSPFQRVQYFWVLSHRSPTISPLEASGMPGPRKVWFLLWASAYACAADSFALLISPFAVVRSLLVCAMSLRACDRSDCACESV